MGGVLFDRVTVVPMTEGPPVLKDAYVHVEGEKIAYVGLTRPEGFSGDVIDGKNKVLLPGLINAHTHSPMTALRGYADGYDLHTWLHDHIFPAEAKLDAPCVSAAADIALMEMAASGTTGFSDMYFCSSAIAERTAKAGLKVNLSTGLVAFSEDFDFKASNDGRDLISLLETYGKEHPLVRPDASIHGEYTSHMKAWRSVAEFAKEQGLLIHLHLSETEREHEACVSKYKKTPLSLFLEAGVLENRVLAAHSVWCSSEDLRLMAEYGVIPVHNPISNQKLASGTAPIPEMLRLGIAPALGTDGTASNNSLDMFEEMKSAAILQGATQYDPTAIKAHTVLKMATVNGAKAQGRENECGRICAGLDADFILVDFDRPHLFPCYDVLSNLVFSARGSDVTMNMVRGKVIYRNGEFLTLDFERAKAEFEKHVLSKLQK